MAQYQARDHVIREAFLQALGSEGATVQKVRDLAEGQSDPYIRSLLLELGNATREVYSVRGVGIINIHIKSEPPGWWNIMESVDNHFALLSTMQIHCFYVLILGRKDQHVADGYIATDINQPPFIQRPTIKSGKFYSVTERQHLDRNKLILSIGKIARTLIQQGSAPSPLLAS
jgi:hypothetical protein